MKFSKEEEKFWKTPYHFDKPSQLDKIRDQVWSVDGSEDGDYFYFFHVLIFIHC